MKPKLTLYNVFLKRHGQRSLLAFGYTRDENNGYIYFHAKEDMSDRDRFFVESELSGIERELSECEIAAGNFSMEDFNAMIAALPTVNEMITNKD